MNEITYFKAKRPTTQSTAKYPRLTYIFIYPTFKRLNFHSCNFNFIFTTFLFVSQAVVVLFLIWILPPQIKGRPLRVDHVESYKVPKLDDDKVDEMTLMVREHGVAPSVMHLYEKKEEEEEEDDSVEELEVKMEVKEEPSTRGGECNDVVVELYLY